MAQHNQLGKSGEDVAINYLVENGYSIVESNWRFKHKEIDIIAQKENTLVIVEVKTRSTEGWEHPKDAVTNAKIRFLVDAAEAYILKTNSLLETRFDIITLIPKGHTWQIEHIEEAFHPLL
jgi:putative endonuclease